MKIQWALILSLVLSPVMSWKFKKYPYADMSIEEKVAHDGYPLEAHKIITKDNYILTTYRIPHGRNVRNSTSRSPVFLSHGLGASPEMFILLGNKSLAYSLADSGFDVWLQNSRGNKKSQSHKYYNLNTDKRYWNYSFHEVAIFDIPANIDYIVKKTGQKTFIIGHSQGNTVQLIMLCEKPEYNEKVKLGVVYAPSVKLYLANTIITVILYIADLIKSLYDFLDIRELIPFNPNTIPLGRDLCKEQTYVLQLCFHILSIVGTHPSRIMEKDLVPVIIGATHSRVSVLQLMHYIQITKSGFFGYYNYGTKKNMQVYGNVTPPEYDLKKITTPIAIFYAEKDDIGTVKGAEETIKALPNVIFHEKVDFKHFNHIDFLFGNNASELVYQKTIKILNDFDNSLKIINRS